MQDSFVAVLPGGGTQASVSLPEKLVDAHAVPFEQSELLQHVSSHLPAVQTPERQSPSPVHDCPGVFRPSDVRPMELPGMQ